MSTNNIINAVAADDAAIMPSIANKKILMGFWHNWAAGASDGYQQGQFATMNLTDIPAEYNVVAVAFMKGQGIPTFKPYNLSDAEFRRQVGVLNSQGRAVLISLGGADAHIELKTGDEDKLKDEIIPWWKSMASTAWISIWNRRRSAPPIIKPSCLRH